MTQIYDHIDTFAGKRVLVVGDVMLDVFVYGSCARISPEAPIPIVRVEREDVMLGGAGNVARNVAALGGEAILVGASGDDAAADELDRRIADEPGVTADLVRSARPTTRKLRYVVGHQQMLRADIESHDPVDPEPLYRAVERQLPTADALVLSDYAKGVLTPELLARAIARARALGIPIVADPKSSDVARYDGASVLTPNAGEAAQVAGGRCDTDPEVERAARTMLDRMPGSAAVLITRGAAGMTLARQGGAPLHLSTAAREVFDVSGAGDTVVATLALALAAGVEIATATEISNVAAGLAVGKAGTAVVTATELVHELRLAGIGLTDRKIATLDEARDMVAGWRRQGRRIGFTNGCFDLLHPGHVSQLAQARAQCDRLIVGLNTDDSVRRLKGPSRPIQDEVARSIVLASLQSVDLVILFGDETPLALIEALRPDVLVKGKDYTVEQVVGADVVMSYGGTVFLADIAEGHSTTGIAARLSAGGGAAS